LKTIFGFWFLTSDANSGSARVIFRAIAPEVATSEAFGTFCPRLSSFAADARKAGTASDRV
jgi:hypothetical protein